MLYPVANLINLRSSSRVCDTKPERTSDIAFTMKSSGIDLFLPKIASKVLLVSPKSIGGI